MCARRTSDSYNFLVETIYLKILLNSIKNKVNLICWNEISIMFPCKIPFPGRRDRLQAHHVGS